MLEPLLLASYVIGGIVCSLVCGGCAVLIAERKHRSQIEGFLYGLLLGPLGILIEARRPALYRTQPFRRTREALDAMFQWQIAQQSGTMSRSPAGPVEESPDSQALGSSSSSAALVSDDRLAKAADESIAGIPLVRVEALGIEDNSSPSLVVPNPVISLSGS